MMIEHATVIGYQNGIATVQCQAKSGCGSCDAQTSCGTKSLSALAGEKFAPQFELAVPEPLQIGEKIEIGIAEQSLLKGIFWLYGLPLLTLLASTLLLSHWITNEVGLAIGVFVSTALVFKLIKIKLSQQPQGQFIPHFLRKI